MCWAEAWLDEATSRGVQRNPNSMTMVTVAADGQPSSRVVLCKAFRADPGYLVFYTNYGSRKVTELDANPLVAASFHWDVLGRQIRLEGRAVRSPAAESDNYFASRDRGSQLGAWASDQSAPIATREALLEQLRSRAKNLGFEASEDLQTISNVDRPSIPRPSHWGGIRIWPSTVELWIEGQDRIHDRARWNRTLQQTDEHEFAVGQWRSTRLQP
jgi:pyridoxamine 5'-phosphate oxidase